MTVDETRTRTVTKMKKFELFRTSVRRDEISSRIIIAPDPDAAKKVVEASSKDDLLQQMREFGAELGRACDVSHKHLGRGPGFMKLPWRIECCTDNLPHVSLGHRLQEEYLERARRERDEGRSLQNPTT